MESNYFGKHLASGMQKTVVGMEMAERESFLHVLEPPFFSFTPLPTWAWVQGSFEVRKVTGQSDNK
jgi:hypothetical protein